jgi:oligopeptide/dipeptide ABC transporter ATP-binding protein
MSAPLLEVSSLSRDFALRGGWPRRRAMLRAVDGVSFTLSEGRTFGLVGESGCGKTTLARAVLRLIEPSTGSVRLQGREITALSRRQMKSVRRRMQMVFQDPYASLPPRLPVGRTLREPMDVHRLGERGRRNDRVAELLDTVGLDAGAAARYPHEFSGGQRQRIAIARALASRPRLLIADEAVASLDVSVKSAIVNLLGDLQRRFGIGMVFISHDLAIEQHVADEIGVMYLGRLVEIAPVTRLFSMPAHPYTRSLLDAVPVPDPARTRNRGPLPGEVPSSVERPSGCPFHTRCPEAFDLCRRRAPRTINVGTREEPHLVDCHLHDFGPRVG